MNHSCCVAPKAGEESKPNNSHKNGKKNVSTHPLRDLSGASSRVRNGKCMLTMLSLGCASVAQRDELLHKVYAL